MINPDVKLVADLFQKEKLEFKPTRDGYGKGLVVEEYFDTIKAWQP